MSRPRKPYRNYHRTAVQVACACCLVGIVVIVCGALSLVEVLKKSADAEQSLSGGSSLAVSGTALFGFGITLGIGVCTRRGGLMRAWLSAAELALSGCFTFGIMGVLMEMRGGDVLSSAAPTWSVLALYASVALYVAICYVERALLLVEDGGRENSDGKFSASGGKVNGALFVVGDKKSRVHCLSAWPGDSSAI